MTTTVTHLPTYQEHNSVVEGRDWERLHALSTRVFQISDLKEQLTEVLLAIVTFHGSQKGIISLFSAQTSALAPISSVGLSQKTQDALSHIRIGEGASGRAFESKSRVIVSDTELDPIYAPYIAVARIEGVRSDFSTPFFDSIGEPIGVLSVYNVEPRIPSDRELLLTDICVAQLALLVQRNRSEAALRKEQERSHQIFSSIKGGFLLMDADFRVQQINAEGLRIDGRSQSEVIGRKHWELWPGSEELPVGEGYKRAIRERVVVSLEQYYPHFNRNLWLDVQAIPLVDGLAVFFRDISARKSAEIMLREREEQLRLATEAADVSLWDVDIVAGTLFWPSSVKAMFGISSSRHVTMADYYEGLHPADREATIAAFANACDPELRATYDVEYRTVGREDKKIRWIAAKGRGIFDIEGRCIRVIGTALDITERKAGEEALRQSEERLRCSDRKKDEFLAMLAHELRNPLAPISAAAELLKLTHSDNERISKASSTISRQVKHMASLVDDLLDVSRVTRGLVVLESEEVDVRQIAYEALEQVRPLLNARGHHFEMVLPLEPAYVHGDRKRLIQVLANLLNNAAKYTPDRGHISLQLSIRSTEIVINVEDSGIGMTRQTMEQVFEMFAQAERTSDRTQGALGIGLALVKSLVELHGGTIATSSEGLGKGSKFQVLLPRLTGELRTCLFIEQSDKNRPVPCSGTLRHKVVNRKRG
jgi:PAS domain S-box-containing protein